MTPKAILADLIGFPTVSGTPTDRILAYIRDRLTPYATEMLAVPGPDPTLQNLLVRIGPDGPGGVMLSGHMDVVPVTDQPWTVPPFTATERDGRLYGRGACDMKGFLACMIAAAPQMAEAALKRPIWLCFSYDEETGCLGVPHVVAQMQARGMGIDAVIVGEPSMMAVIDRHKGVFVEEVTFHGVACHSSLPWMGVSANEYAAEFAVALRDMAQAFLAEVAERDRATTINIGQIHGGTTHNIMADRCSVLWSLRTPADADAPAIIARIQGIADALAQRMQAADPRAHLTRRVEIDVRGLAPDPASAALHLAQQLTGQNSAQSVNYGTEAGIFQTGGFSAIICGPGSITQAHQADEWIDLAQLDACIAFIARLIARQSTGASSRS